MTFTQVDGDAPPYPPKPAAGARRSRNRPAVVAADSGVADDVLDRQAEIVGYAYKRMDGVAVAAEPLVTTAGSSGPTVPFVGLAEAYMLAAFRSAGVPMQRIRPAIHWLEQNIGLEQALASERLMTDGAEVLWNFREQTNDPAEREAVDGLVVVTRGSDLASEHPPL